MSDKQITCSMLWAAYGDALGFITELADKPMLRRRLGKDGRVDRLVSWPRRVGGRFGIDIELPAGCYSDDTQLRLATCRSIRSNGSFDIESFAKVELPVWRAYALGAGKGSKVAAKNFTKLDVQWCGNFFAESRARYTDGGCNGAAMRIQPHVWVARSDQRDSDIVKCILKNSITTHGHPRGFIGASFHGLCVRASMQERKATGVRDWLSIADNLAYVGKLIRSDRELNTFWLSAWEQRSQTRIDDLVGQTVKEIVTDVELLADLLKAKQDPASIYVEGVNAIGGFTPASRGSGTKTALLASFLAILFQEEPDVGLKVAANCLGNDTDTIATMAGAIFGALLAGEPPEQVADMSYLVSEAERLADIREGAGGDSFSYPDLLTWQPPIAEIDYLRPRSKRWYLAGLGEVTAVGEEKVQKGKSPTIWQWFRLGFGQCVLLKRRSEPESANQELLPFDEGETKIKKRPGVQARTKFDLAQAKADALKAGYAPEVVGEILLRLAKGPNGIEDSVAFAAAVADAQRRKDRSSSS